MYPRYQITHGISFLSSTNIPAYSKAISIQKYHKFAPEIDWHPFKLAIFSFNINCSVYLIEHPFKLTFSLKTAKPQN